MNSIITNQLTNKTMSSTKHVNGNWTVVNDVLYANPLSDDPFRNIPIATISKHFGNESMVSNGKLISAAPDLLEACILLRKLINLNDGHLVDEKLTALMKANNAVKKAIEQ